MSKPSKIVAELRDAAKEAWPPTVRFFEWARANTSTPEFTTTEELTALLEIKPSEAKELFTGIERLHLAKFIVGRRKSLPPDLFGNFFCQAFLR